ncbi:MAG: hypothetical protein Sapg2KO_41370 [Saprospiraceae bacterium]
MKCKITLFLTLFCASFVYSQVNIQRNFNLELAEKDSLTSAKIEASLQGFLAQAQNGDYSSEYVDPEHQKEFEFFFNKLAGIGKDNHPDFNEPIILKSFTADHETYQLTVAFTGQRDGVPFIYQITELQAVPYQDHYRFYCPFRERTANFKRQKIKNVTFYYSGSINEQKAIEFADFKEELSLLTQTPNEKLDYYCFASLDELLKSYGFVYSARQCNFLCYDLGFTDSNGKIYVTGTNNENYRFGYIGDYLYANLPNKESMYWPFVQGLSTYYGGYGLSYENVAELKQQFKAELQRNPQIDFLEEFKKGRKSSVNRHFSYYVMSAFLCEEIIKQKGFDGVLKLVYSGEDGNSFFANLKDVLNIDEQDFHQNILRMINES